jgi:hypothetical protein
MRHWQPKCVPAVHLQHKSEQYRYHFTVHPTAAYHSSCRAMQNAAELAVSACHGSQQQHVQHAMLG